MEEPSGCLDGSYGIFEVVLVIWSYIIYRVPRLPFAHAGDIAVLE